MRTYLFYDLDASGENVAFDQVLRFAAIRTDDRFDVLDEHDVSMRLRREVVPAPVAVLRHGWSVEALRAEGEAEVDAIRTVHGLMNEPGTIGLGYRTIDADDEMLRFAFFRNLLDPYTHQYANDCGRMDLEPMVVLERLRGRTALDDLLRHEASGDGEGPARGVRAGAQAALALARQLASDRARWDELAGYFDPAVDEARLAALPTFRIGGAVHPVALMVDPAFGAERAYQRPVVGLGRHRYYANQSRWLALDTPQLPEVATQPIRSVAEVVRKKLGVPGFLLSWKDEAANRLDEARRSLARQNLAWLREHPALFQQMAGYYREATYRQIPNLDADAALYQIDRFTEEEKARFERFHAAETVDEKAALIPEFERTVVQTLALRVLLRNEPASAWPPVVRRYADAYRRRIYPRTRSDVLVDHRGDERRTPADALRAIERLRAEGLDGAPLDAERHRLLDELERHVQTASRSPRRALSA